MDEPKELNIKDLSPVKNFGLDSEAMGFRRRYVSSSATPEAIETSWNTDFTNPLTHNEAKFRYLIHGLQGQSGEIIQMLAAIDLMKKQGKGDILQQIDLLEQPHLIGDRKVISASVIDQDHRVTFGNGGLILRTPFSNILDAAPQDLGTNFVDPENTINTSERRLCTIDELIKASTNDEWNEVRLLGRTPAGEVNVSGYWIKVGEDGRPLDPEVAERLINLANRDRKPLIKIVDKAKRLEFTDNPPEVHREIRFKMIDGKEKIEHVPWAFSINRSGVRYFLDFERGKFDIINEKGHSRPMTDEEFIFAKGIIEVEMDPAQREKVQDITAHLQEQYDASKQ